MDPISFPRAAASPNVHIMPSNVHSFPVSRAQHVKCHHSAVQGSSFYQLGAVRTKKPITPPKGPTCALEFSNYPSSMDPILFAVAAASPSVHLLPTSVH